MAAAVCDGTVRQRQVGLTTCFDFYNLTGAAPDVSCASSYTATEGRQYGKFFLNHHPKIGRKVGIVVPITKLEDSNYENELRAIKRLSRNQKSDE